MVFFGLRGAVLFEVTKANHIPELNNSAWVLLLHSADINVRPIYLLRVRL